MGPPTRHQQGHHEAVMSVARFSVIWIALPSAIMPIAIRVWAEFGWSQVFRGMVSLYNVMDEL